MTGNAIKDLRTELGMTSSAFAQLLGVNPSTLYRWEAEGEKEVKPDPNAARILAAMQKVRETKGSADLSSTLGAALLIGGGLFALFKLLEHLFSDSTANTAATAAPSDASAGGMPRAEGQPPTSGPSSDGKGGA